MSNELPWYSWLALSLGSVAGITGIVFIVYIRCCRKSVKKSELETTIKSSDVSTVAPLTSNDPKNEKESESGKKKDGGREQTPMDILAKLTGGKGEQKSEKKPFVQKTIDLEELEEFNRQKELEKEITQNLTKNDFKDVHKFQNVESATSAAATGTKFDIKQPKIQTFKEHSRPYKPHQEVKQPIVRSEKMSKSPPLVRTPAEPPPAEYFDDEEEFTDDKGRVLPRGKKRRYLDSQLYKRNNPISPDKKVYASRMRQEERQEMNKQVPDDSKK